MERHKIKKKICFVIASRANYGRVKSVIIRFKKSKEFVIQVVLAASALLERYGDLKKILKKDKIKIDREAYLVVEGETPYTMAKSTGVAIMELSSIFNDLKPDFVFTVGDRYETIATAISASYMNIILVHIQGGEVTGSIDESVRHSITKLSHIHFPATEKAKRNITKMGEDKRFVFNVGCPSFDLFKNKINIKKINTFLNGVGSKIDLKNKYNLVVFHPVTTEYGISYEQTQKLINVINNLNVQTIWLWPNVDAGSDGISKCLRKNRENKNLRNVQLIKNFPVEFYNYLLKSATCLIGNSSSFIREASFFGTPTVLIGNRQQNREVGTNVIRSSFKETELIKKIKKQMGKKYKKNYLYGNGNAASKIYKIFITLSPPIQKQLKY
jgi:UDP-hydrolysing UDP-N-acetyl-D-glucosamine 2-epimerase